MTKRITRTKVSKKGKNEEAASIFFSDGTDLNNRVIHITGEIEPFSINAAICGLQLLVEKSKEPIKLYINSFGGDPYSAFALYDYIRSLEEVEVYTYVIGACMSAATIIFLAGDERFSYKNSVFMLHTVSSMADGKLNDMMDEIEECKRIFAQMMVIYAENSTLTKLEWARKLKHHDVYIRSDEALRLGFLTKIVE